MNLLKYKYRKLHISKNWIRLNNVLRFNKKYLKFLDVSKRKPNLIIVGSQKCGTTSLFKYLSSHPNIAPSSPEKEPGYYMFNEFIIDLWAENNIFLKNKNDLFKRLMAKNLTDEFYFMEASTYYTQDTNEIKFNVVNNIARVSQKAKILYIIRNPFQRLISVYYHQKRKGDIVSIETIANNSWYINTCLYYNRIIPFIEKMGKKNVHLLCLEDLEDNPQKELNKIYEFLDIEKFNYKFYPVHNKTSVNQSLKFDVKSYNLLFPIFLEQKKLLQNNLKLVINWNLEKDYWVNNEY